MKDTLQRWLQAHCERSEDVAGGVVLARTPAGELQGVAQWPALPASAQLATGLATVARESVRRGRSLTLVPAVVQKDAGHARVVALPLRADELVVGAVALAVRSSDTAVANALLQGLELSAPSLAQALSAPDDAGGIPHALHKLQDLVASAEHLHAAALKLANYVAQEYSFDRVSVGYVDHGRMNVAAISRGSAVDERQDLVRAIGDAMQEAADQKTLVQHPAGLQPLPSIAQAHARLCARAGTVVCTAPLVCDGVVTGALSFERKGSTPMTAADVGVANSVAGMVAAVLELKRQADRAWWRRASDGLRGWWQRRGRRGRRIGLVAGLLLGALLLFLPVTFRVGAPARVEGAVQRVLVAPMDGFLRQTRVRPGDSVKQGDVLVELADQELLLEKRKWESELARHQNNFSFAMGRSDRAQFAINYARAAEAKAQLELVESQLSRAHVVAPMDALVIQGDLTQVIGAPVKRGDTLLTLAPADRYRIIVEADERDIAHVRLGQRGRLALAAMPGEVLNFTVQRVTPVANVTRDGRNAFDVEAKLDAGSVVPRHGLQGVAKIEVGQRSLVWIATRRVVGWLRLSIWGWLP